MWNRIIGPTLLVVFFWLAFTGVVAIAMYWVGRFHLNVVAETGITIQAANSMSDTLWKEVSMVLATDSSNRKEMDGEIGNLQKEFEHSLVRAEDTSYTKTEQGISRNIRQKYSDLQTQVRQRLSPPFDKSPKLEAAKRDILAAADSIASLCRELRVFNEELASADVDWQSRVMTFFVLAFMGILIVGVVAGMLWSIHTASQVDSSVSEISISLGTADSQLEEELGRIGLNVSGNLDRLREQVDLVADRIRKVVEDLQEERRKSIVASRLALAGELAAGVAHEIRNPLTALKLLLHAAAENTPNRSLSTRQFEVIQSEIGRMEKIVQGLLDFARPPHVNRVRHDLRATLNRALQLTEGLANRRRVAVRCAFPESPALIDADPGQLHQVFLNLLLNAIEAMPEGGSLRISIEAENGEEKFYRVVFADSGPGIPAQVAKRLFEPFVSGKKNGVGLGLAVSRRLVLEQGGQIRALNAESGGAKVTVELPAAAPVKETAGEAAKETAHA